MLAQTHEYGFANDEVFTGLHKVLTNDSFSVVMKSSILEILSTVGYVLDEVIELKAQESGTADTSIAKTLCNTIRFQCKTPHIKLAIKALQSIGRGDTYCRNFSQPIVGQISNTAARTIKEELVLRNYALYTLSIYKSKNIFVRHFRVYTMRFLILALTMHSE